MADWEIIEEKRHSDFGASQAYKRINCLGSRHMEANFPNETSEYAAQGTKAHGVAETMARAAVIDNWALFGTRRAVERAYFFNRHQSNIIEATEMMDGAEDYVSYIRQILKEHTDAKVLLFEFEHAFDLSSLRPDLYGTCDCILILEYVDQETGEIIVHMHVIDYKFGAGVVVGALENDQLAYYGLGAWHDVHLLYDVTRVSLHIVQPRVKNFDSWTVDIDWLTTTFRTRLLTAYDASRDRNAPLTPGDWCASSFCRARGNCPAVVKKAIEVTKEYGQNPLVRQVWSSDAVAMEMIGVVRAWAKAREEQIKRKILNGEQTDATQYFKVVQGRSSRHWDDENALARKYPASQHPLLWHPPQFKSVAQIEKAVKDDDILGTYDFTEEFANHVVKTPGSPTITRIEDSRVAIDRTDQARNEFALEDQRTKDPLDDLLG